MTFVGYTTFVCWVYDVCWLGIRRLFVGYTTFVGDTTFVCWGYDVCWGGYDVCWGILLALGVGPSINLLLISGEHEQVQELLER